MYIFISLIRIHLRVPDAFVHRITHAPVADVFVIWAKLVDAEPSAKTKPPKAGSKASTGPPSSSIRGFIVERGARGLSTPVIEGKLSLRTSVTGQVALEDVRVPAENLLPGAKGLSVRVLCLSCPLAHLTLTGCSVK